MTLVHNPGIPIQNLVIKYIFFEVMRYFSE